ncbi:MAG: isopeptide-forming domain-containing fimbrial protein [Clostridia bacterium]|nr:isopeptide-forming domain-containing fimbrial protein [Clostridia bacterium]
MNLKKLMGMFMAVMMILFATLTIGQGTTYAANSNYVLGITNVREPQNGKLGGAYGVGGLKSDGTPTKKVWKIVSYPTTSSNTIDYSNAFYCLMAEHGFVSQDTTNVTAVKRNYNLHYDMKLQKQEVLTRLNNTGVFTTDATSYNKIMWIIDNMYLPKQSTSSEKIALLTNAGIIDSDYTIEHARITDDDIEVVQQMALWYFTNTDSSIYHTESLQELYFNNWSGKDESYKTFEDLYNDSVAGTRDGLYRQQECEMLYKYFITTAKTKGDYVSMDTTSPLTLDKARVQLAEENGNYVIGPFKINQNSTLTYTLDKLGFTDETGKAFSYTLLDANKNKVANNDIESIFGQDFYISVPDTTTISSIKFDFGITYAKTTATYYTTDESTYRNEQPVVLVEKQPIVYEDNVTIQMPAPKVFDLALRKFISGINGNAPLISREPVVDTSGLKAGTSTTAIYNHPKAPLSVEVGDIVTYTIRVYNEGEKDGYVSEITDHLPPQLEFLAEDEENIANGWIYDENDTSLRTIKTSHLSRDIDTDNIIKAYDGGNTLDYKDITVKCKVVAALNYDKRIVNIADITGFTDKNGNTVIDRDSQASNVVLPSDENLPNYKEEEINRGDKYIPGQQDDDDFDNVRITYFDLALRKFITAVNEKVPSVSREPVVDISGLVAGTSTTAIYNHPKEPVEVKVGDIVTYTIRIYNEGPKDGYASEITDHLPPQLEFLPDDKENIAKGWTYDETDDTHRTIKTNYLSKEKNENNLIKAFNGKTLSYKDITVKCKVTADAKYDKRIVNIADITGFTDKNGNTVKDIDSEKDNVVLPSDENLPNYKEEEINRGDKYIPGQQDDDDFDNVKIVYFDLALRKFITKVDNLDVNNRYPELSMGEDGNIKYNHTKEPVLVANGNIVTYTIRIFNEGTMNGYAKEVTDDLPEGLLFLPQNDTNIQYRWKMIDKDGNETEDVEKAVKITTDYLSKEQEKQPGENLLKAFDKETGITDTNPDHRDVKVAFKVTEPNTSDRILINTAEISEDSDEFDKPVDDIDSTPGNDKDGEDDIDIDKVRVKYFDLALKKWVTQAIVIENGKQTVTETGHTGNENPEPVVKVDLKAKDLKKVIVKFKYKIKVTNEGEIEGYVKELKDYIPDGLKFDAKDNPKWKQISDKQVTTDQLKDLLLKPGESATVDIILTWENSDKNLGLKVNWAEISKDYNDYDDTPDIDSTPDNNKPGEDDIDNAPVILAIKTGEARIYFGLTTIILVTLAGGIYLIKKFVL